MARVKPIDLLVTYRVAFDFEAPDTGATMPLKRSPTRYAGAVRQRGLTERRFTIRYRCDALPLPDHPWEAHDHPTVDEAMACAATIADVMRQRYSQTFNPHFVHLHTTQDLRPLGDEPSDDAEAAAVPDSSPPPSMPPLTGRPVTDVHSRRR